MHEVQHEFVHVDKGFFYTTKELLIRPGHSIREYIMESRYRHFKPIAFLFICSVIYTFLDQKIGVKPPVQTLEGNVGKMLYWISENYSYANLVEIFFIGLFVCLFFRRKGFNYFENIVLLCYVTGFAMLIGVLFMIAGYVFKSETITSYYPWILFLYIVWAIGQFYDHRNAVSYLKALLAYVVGFFTFVILSIILAMVLEKAGVIF
ncbi:DUF3667 domain-containing protein [Pollutibacter soli]|uniref:DUF3667 domain-containing protein n=1 Tax=Pollutibacter soli TaxID=3034157 RepID=UPI00301403DD